jgi:hypothetical protein
VDARLVNNLVTYTSQFIDSQDEVGGYPVVPAFTRPAGWDSDNDGMPNWWEYDHGFNSSANDGSVITASGYSRLENYLNYIPNMRNWAVDANGNWSSDANWFGGSPNGTNAAAAFYSEALNQASFSAARTVTVDAPRTVGMIDFDSTASFTLNGAATITLDDGSDAAAVNVLRGNHTISAPLNLADNTTFVAMNASNSLTVAGPMTADGKTLTKQGAGSVQFENVRAAALNVNAGMVKISAKATPNDPSGTSTVNSLSIASGAQLDLANNSMVIDYPGAAGTLENDVRVLLQTGKIVSSSAGTPAGTKLGYADDSAAGTLLIKFTYGGDANLDGVVSIADLGELASNWQATGAVWREGDFNYDGQVTIADLGELASNWQAGVGSPLGMTFQQALAAVGLGGVAVPEPAISAAVVLLCGILTRRARGRHVE